MQNPNQHTVNISNRFPTSRFHNIQPSKTVPPLLIPLKLHQPSKYCQECCCYLGKSNRTLMMAPGFLAGFKSDEFIHYLVNPSFYKNKITLFYSSKLGVCFSTISLLSNSTKTIKYLFVYNFLRCAQIMLKTLAKADKIMCTIVKSVWFYQE